MELPKVSGVWAALVACTLSSSLSLSPWDHWGQEIECSDSMSNYETNLNPVLSEILFLESHQWGGMWASGVKGWCCGPVGGERGEQEKEDMPGVEELGSEKEASR